jgi:hypothetical protein
MHSFMMTADTCELKDPLRPGTCRGPKEKHEMGGIATSANSRDPLSAPQNVTSIREANFFSRETNERRRWERNRSSLMG